MRIWKICWRSSGDLISKGQIFIGDKHIGGCDDLYGLDADGKLDELLAA